MLFVLLLFYILNFWKGVNLEDPMQLQLELKSSHIGHGQDLKRLMRKSYRREASVKTV